MFDFLKKKISGFVDKITKEEEAEPEKEIIEETPEEVPKAVEKKEVPNPQKKVELPKKKEKPVVGKKAERAREKPVPEKKVTEKKPEGKKEAPPKKTEPEKPFEVAPKKKLVIEKTPEKEPEPVIEMVPGKETEIEEIPEPAEIIPEPRIETEKPTERIKLGAVGAIKSFITREVEISESDVRELLDNLELELLESDVELSVAESILEDLTEKLIGAKIKKADLHSFVNNSIKETLIDTISNEKAFNIVEKLSSFEKPVKIMFLGVNGAGKTTTIGKVARLLMDNDKKVVFAAADTFRAAAIEQMEVHADRLGVKMIKRDYGSDPTSVAYDAMNYAKARGIDAVLIDTAGRQDTNISLINEIKKMNRVIKPELKIYIGESIAGNAILEQIQTFNREIGIDGVILTKLDCDPKGGTMLSINKTTGIPIIYVGVGQGYGDLELFDAPRIVERIVE